MPCGAMRSVSACTSLTHCVACVIVGRHIGSGAGALQYPKKNPKNGNKKELYFTFRLCVFTFVCNYPFNHHLIDVHSYKFVTCLDIKKHV